MQDLSIRQQATLFTLMLVARPATNRELQELAGLKVEGPAYVEQYMAKKKRGGTNTYVLTKEGWEWCESALLAGRPDGTKFPGGVLYLTLEAIGQFLAREPDTTLDAIFRPDLETWIRAIYTELTVRTGAGAPVPLRRVRDWLDGVPRADVDAELDRMIELPDVDLTAELNQKALSDVDNAAAVEIGGEPRHALRIGPA